MRSIFFGVGGKTFCVVAFEGGKRLDSATYETIIQPQCAPPEKENRISRTHENSRWSPGVKPASFQEKKASLRLTDFVRPVFILVQPSLLDHHLLSARYFSLYGRALPLCTQLF